MSISRKAGGNISGDSLGLVLLTHNSPVYILMRDLSTHKEAKDLWRFGSFDQVETFSKSRRLRTDWNLVIDATWSSTSDSTDFQYQLTILLLKCLFQVHSMVHMSIRI